MQVHESNRLGLSFIVMTACVMCGCAHRDPGVASKQAKGPTPVVAAIAATEPVQTTDDAADDPAIWIHPGNGNLSLVLGTNKKEGLEVYDLSGRRLQALKDGKVNNVDVVQGQTLQLAFASNRTDQSIRVYEIEPSTQRVRPLPERSFASGLDEIYGLCAFMTDPQQSLVDVVAASKSGIVRHFRMDPAPGGKAPVMITEWAVGGQIEGMVADVHHGWLYIGEEMVGLWRYALDPAREPRRMLVDLIAGPGRSGLLAPDVEGVTLMDAGNGAGWIVVSCQGENRYATYDRMTLQYTGDFAISFRTSAGLTDAVTHTDGIAACGKVGPEFPSGLFVAQDDNDGQVQNFKIVDRRAIEAVLAPAAETR